ncbi:MAG TPA: peptidylprolyl isomerase [Thermoanaerobaculia bacterium]
MKRTIIAFVTLLGAAAAFAQSTAPAPPSDEEKIVAVVNGETITKVKLDTLYNNLSVPIRTQYDKSGGKMAFLDYYVQRRLVLQEAIKSGFDKKSDVQATVENAKEQALYEKYVNDVVAAGLVTDADARKFYEEHKSEFAEPEKAKVRHIVISWNRRPKPDALELIKRVATEIRAGAPVPRPDDPDANKVLMNRFSAAARQYSEDGSAQSGGDLGWVAKGTLDPAFEEAAFGMQPMTMSGIVESAFGYHLIFVEAKKPAGTQSFSEAKSDIREFLMGQKATDIVGMVRRLTNELRANSKVAFYPENLK